MKRFSDRWLVLVPVLMMCVWIGCAEDSGTKPTVVPDETDPLAVSFPQYRELVERVAPPAFTGSAARGFALLDDGDDLWSEGDHPILGKVFSTNEPMSLYRNLNDLDRNLQIVEQIASGMEPGERTVEVESPEGPVEATVRYALLTAPVSIPASCRDMLGIDEVDLDGMVSVRTETMAIDCGFLITDTEETILVWMHETFEGSTGSSMLYARRVIATGVIDIRNTFYKSGSEEIAKWVHQIHTEGDELFTYKMGWFSDGIIGPFSASVVGGGNKDTAFALRYRYWSGDSVDEPEPVEPGFDVAQLFGPVYAKVDSAMPDELLPRVEVAPYRNADMLNGQVESPFPSY